MIQADLVAGVRKLCYTMENRKEGIAMGNSQRLESVRVLVNEILLQMDSAEERLCACAHLYGVSQAAGLLAVKRGLDAELAEAAGLLHDLYAFKTGIGDFHDKNGAEMIRPILRDLGLYSSDEQKLLISAVYHHSEKQRVHGPYDEVLKDADVLQHFLHNPLRKVSQSEQKRLNAILYGFGTAAQYEIGSFVDQRTWPEDKSTELADTAEALAGKHVQGIPEDADFRRICKPWPDDDVYKTLKNQWCAAFVYDCCRTAGFLLPIRHPLGSCRFAAVAAWREWALLPENQFYHPAGETGFEPRRGDLVIYDRLFTESSHDHIGILLNADGDELTVAEGNADNKNKAGVMRREPSHVGGYIRIPNSFIYRCEANFIWELEENRGGKKCRQRASVVREPQR